MNPTLYQQVYLVKGNLVDTVFIPQKLAVTGNYIKRKVDGEWNDGWLIVTVYGGTKSEDEIIAARDRHKYHREGTDI